MAKKQPPLPTAKNDALLQGLFPRITIFPGEDEVSFEGLRQAFKLDLSPGSPYELALVENLVTLEWEAIRHRNIRDQLVLTKFSDLAVGVIRHQKICTVPKEHVDEDAFIMATP
jgi:hypothetical protein